MQRLFGWSDQHERGACNQFKEAKCFNPDDDTQNDKLSHITTVINRPKQYFSIQTKLQITVASFYTWPFSHRFMRVNNSV